MKLKWSQYILVVNSADEKRVILQNTLDGHTIAIKNEIKDILDSVISKNIKDDFVPPYIQDHLKNLVKTGMLVPTTLNEREKYNKFISNAQIIADRKFSLVLVTTTSCQFNCPYCFEQGIKRQEQMDNKTADKIIEWCRNYLDKHPECNQWNIHLIGGEPLLNKGVIKYILPTLNHIAKEKKIPLAIELTTNGPLLDLETLTFLHKNNLDTVNISVDGPKEVHDKRRTDKSNQGSFDKIFQNINEGFKHNLLKKLYLSITCDKQNIDSLPALFDYLVQKKLQNKVNLGFNMIYVSTSEGLGKKVTNSHYQKFDLSENQKAEKYLWLCREAKKRGFLIPKIWQIGPVCQAQSKNSVVIQPNGSLLKCPRGIGHPEFTFGNIVSTENLSDSNFDTPVILDTCFSKNCSLIPICNGGCRLQGYFSNKNFSESFCRKTFMEKVNKGLLQLNFD